MKPIPIYQYVAQNNPEGALRVLRKFNIPKPTSAQDMMKKLRYVIVRFKEEGLTEIANEHPDRELILSTVEEEPKSEKKSGACGCSSAASGHSNCGGNCDCDGCEANASNANGTKDTVPADTNVTKEATAEPPKEEKGDEFMKNTLPYVAVGFIVVGALIAITK